MLSYIIGYTHSDDINRELGLSLLMESLKKQTYKDFEIIVVEDTRGRGMASFPFKDSCNKLIAVFDPQHRPFNLSWVKNIGAEVANSNNLIFSDSDDSFGEDFLEKVYETSLRHGFFSCWKYMRILSGRDNPYERLNTFGKNTKSMMGVFFTTREFFYSIGGNNEAYFGYGGDDEDLSLRARYYIKDIPAMRYTINHNYHHYNSNYPLNINRENLLDATRKNPRLVIDRLVSMRYGKLESPTI